jgi:hypothetical protein
MGDMIVAMEGQAVCHLNDLLALPSGDQIGEAVTVQILRSGQVQEQKVVHDVHRDLAVHAAKAFLQEVIGR